MVTVWALCLLCALLLLAAPSEMLAKGKKDAHLRYATSWADAVAQARARNVPIFATFHKDK